MLDEKSLHGIEDRAFRVGLVQDSFAVGDLTANLERTFDYISRARSRQVDLLVFPELSLSGYGATEAVRATALETSGLPLEALQEAAGDMSLVCGFAERGTDGALYNSSFYLERGRLVHRHRKVIVPRYNAFSEGTFFKGGDQVGVFDTTWGKAAILICADCWNPALAYLAVEQGAKFIIEPSASPWMGLGGTLDSTSMWRSINHATAGLYSSYVMFVNHAGVEATTSFWGGSELVAPDGTVIARGPAGDAAKPALVVGDVDPRRVDQQRRDYPALAQEPREVLSLLFNGLAT